MPLDELLSGSDSSDGGGQSTLADTIADGTDDPVEAYEVQEIKHILSEAIEGMPERERLVLNLYYYNGLTLSEIGEVLGVTESRVCQIHTKGFSSSDPGSWSPSGAWPSRSLLSKALPRGGFGRVVGWVLGGHV